MVGLGCFLVIASFVVMICVGGGIALIQRTNPWIGWAFGLANWFVLMLGYACFLSIVDWFQRKKYPDRIGVPAWVVPMLWILLALSVYVSVLVGRQLF